MHRRVCVEGVPFFRIGARRLHVAIVAWQGLARVLRCACLMRGALGGPQFAESVSDRLRLLELQPGVGVGSAV